MGWNLDDSTRAGDRVFLREASADASASSVRAENELEKGRGEGATLGRRFHRRGSRRAGQPRMNVRSRSNREKEKNAPEHPREDGETHPERDAVPIPARPTRTPRTSPHKRRCRAEYSGGVLPTRR